MAPEIIFGGEYDRKVDVYALIISIWEMFHRMFEHSSFSYVFNNSDYLMVKSSTHL